MANIGPRKKIDIEVSDVELATILNALRIAIENCSYSDEYLYRGILKDLGGEE